jgi:hypothetical protein
VLLLGDDETLALGLGLIDALTLALALLLDDGLMLPLGD